MKKIVITGGHLGPAVAVIEELQKRGGWEIYFLGRKSAFSGQKFLSLEYRTVKKMGIPFYEVETPRLRRELTFKNIFSFLQLPAAIFRVSRVFRVIRAEVILSFGGYVALPVAVVGWFLGIPVITHEQTLKPGLANRIIALFARKVLVGWREVVREFRVFRGESLGRVVWVGNPLRASLFKVQPRTTRFARVRGRGLRFKDNEQTIYITGGSTGSHSINKVVMEILPDLLEKYRVIHQSGESEYQDYEQLNARRYTLDAELRKRYCLKKHLELREVGEMMRKADIIVGRAGANTVTEIALLGKPAILIPLPWAAYGEQLANAEKLAREGGAVILRQEELTEKTLLKSLNELAKNLEEYSEKAYHFSQSKEVKKHRQATAFVVDILEHLLSRGDGFFPKKGRIRKK